MISKANNTNSIQIANEVFDVEIQSLEAVKATIDENFTKAVDMILATKGKVIVTGMGKSGHIGAKIAATLASTGTPAFFVHPAEMGHGDLGMLSQDDIVLAISYSGNTEELRKVLNPIKKLGLQLISITGFHDSVLAKSSDVTLLTPITQEACPLDLAPTSSTTVALVIGDALAVALMKHKNFQKQDFAKSHPLGSLGKSFVQIAELMRVSTDIPKVSPSANLEEVLQEISSKAMGFTNVVDHNNKLLGTITDGDLRRAQMKFAKDIFDKTAEELMNTNPKTATPDTFASRAADIMKEFRISTLVIVDNNFSPIGVLDLKDMLAEGFIV